MKSAIIFWTILIAVLAGILFGANWLSKQPACGCVAADYGRCKYDCNTKSPDVEKCLKYCESKVPEACKRGSRNDH